MPHMPLLSALLDLLVVTMMIVETLLTQDFLCTVMHFIHYSEMWRDFALLYIYNVIIMERLNFIMIGN